MALHRSRRNRMIAGVCGGLAESLGWDPTMVRLLYVLVSILSAAFPGTPRLPRPLGRRPRVAGLRPGQARGRAPRRLSPERRRRLGGERSRPAPPARPGPDPAAGPAAAARRAGADGRGPVRDRFRRGRAPASARAGPAGRALEGAAAPRARDASSPTCASTKALSALLALKLNIKDVGDLLGPLAAEAGPPEEAARGAPDAGAARGRSGAAAAGGAGSSAGGSGRRRRWTIPVVFRGITGAAWRRRWSGAASRRWGGAASTCGSSSTGGPGRPSTSA